MPRKIIQISGTDDRIFALCDDGTLWEYNQVAVWTLHENVPQTTSSEEIKDLKTYHTGSKNRPEPLPISSFYYPKQPKQKLKIYNPFKRWTM